MKKFLPVAVFSLGAITLACSGGGLPPVSGLGTSSVYACSECKIWDVKVIGDRAYLADIKRKSLVILDVSDPANPTELSALKVDRINALDSDGKYVYIGGSQNLTTVNVSDPANPTETGQTNTSGSTYGVDLHNGIIFSGGGVFDLTDPANPNKQGVLYEGNSTSGYGVEGSTVVAGKQSSGLSVHDISNPAAPTEVGTLEMSYATEVVIKDNIAFVGDYNEKKVFLVDISNPAAPSIVGEALEAGGSATAIERYEDFLVIGSNYGGVKVFDISNPAAPVKKWEAKPEGMSAYKLDATDAGVFVASGEKGLFFLAWERAE